MPLPDARGASHWQITQWMVAQFGDLADVYEIDTRWRQLGIGMRQRQARDNTPGARWRREKREKRP